MSAPPPGYYYPQPTPPKRRHTGLWITLGIVVGVVAVLIVAGVLAQSGGSPSATSLGSRSQPLPVNTRVAFNDGWTVQMGPSNVDYWATLHKKDDTATAPKTGDVDVAATLTVWYSGTDSVQPGVELDVQFVQGDGNVTDSVNSSCDPVNGGQADLPEMYAGGHGTATVCREVPKTQVAGGVWRVDVSTDFSADPAYIALH